MITNDKKKSLLDFVYYNPEGSKKVLLSLYRALEDGTLRLLWETDRFYLIVSPEILWLCETNNTIRVNSNTDWETF